MCICVYVCVCVCVIFVCLLVRSFMLLSPHHFLFSFDIEWILFFLCCDIYMLLLCFSFVLDNYSNPIRLSIHKSITDSHIHTHIDLFWFVGYMLLFFVYFFFYVFFFPQISLTLFISFMHQFSQSPTPTFTTFYSQSVHSIHISEIRFLFTLFFHLNLLLLLLLYFIYKFLVSFCSMPFENERALTDLYFYLLSFFFWFKFWIFMYGNVCIKLFKLIKFIPEFLAIFV